jgi:hypothetical protein
MGTDLPQGYAAKGAFRRQKAIRCAWPLYGPDDAKLLNIYAFMR